MKNSRASSNQCFMVECNIYSKSKWFIFQTKGKAKKEGGLWMLLILCGVLLYFYFLGKIFCIYPNKSFSFFPFAYQTVSNCTYISFGFRNLSLRLTFIRWMRGKEKRPFIKTNANIFLMKRNSVHFFCRHNSPFPSFSLTLTKRGIE